MDLDGYCPICEHGMAYHTKMRLSDAEGFACSTCDCMFSYPDKQSGGEEYIIVSYDPSKHMQSGDIMVLREYDHHKCSYCKHWWADHVGPIINWNRSCDHNGCTCLTDVRKHPQVLWDQPNNPYTDNTINHPGRYGGDGTYETIKVVEAWKLDFNLGNAVKYISRAEHKGNYVEDLEKAKWYIERAIKNAIHHE